MIILIWLIKLAEISMGISFAYLGIAPLQWSGLPGILFAPLLHGDAGHAFSNSVPLLLLGGSLFYFYTPIALRIFIMSYIFVGLNVWLFSRQGVHIGASGLVYALFGFLLIGGFISRNKRLLALAFLNVFWYGSMIWGIFPTEPNISWESHLIGLLFGILLAYLYLPLKNIKSESHFGNENENGDEGIWQDPQNTDFYHNNSTYNIRFKYHFTEKKDTHEKDSL